MLLREMPSRRLREMACWSVQMLLLQMLLMLFLRGIARWTALVLLQGMLLCLHMLMMLLLLVMLPGCI